MSDHRWQPGEECKTRDGRPCRILNWTSDGVLYWEVLDSGKWYVYSGRPGGAAMQATFAPQPPTRTVVQWHFVYEGQDVYRSSQPGQSIEWELDGDKIVSVRLLDEED